MSDRAPILILTASTGAGHTMAARALAEAFHSRDPEQPVVVQDVLHWSNPLFRAIYGQGYDRLVRWFPAGMGWLYEMTDRQPRRVSSELRSWFQRVSLGPARRTLLRGTPRLIVNTHFLPGELVAELRRRGRLSCPVVTVTTDFETHRMWVQEPTDHYFAATELGRVYLGELGVHSERVTVSGIPVRRAFAEHGDRLELRRRHDLDPERPVIVIQCGAFRQRVALQLLEQAEALLPSIQPVIICGHNAALRERLYAVAAPGVRVLGFSEVMHEWMQLADVMVTKPGGLTTAESLVAGLPLVIVRPIPGPEQRNSDFVLERGAAIRINQLQLLAHRVTELLGDPGQMATMRAAARAAARPDAADRIAGIALGLTGRRQVDKGEVATKNPDSHAVGVGRA